MIAARLSGFFAIALLAANAMAAPLFRQPLPIDLGWVWAAEPGPLVTADFNDDGFPDLAYPHSDGRLVVVLSQAAGPFAPTQFSTVPDSIGSMAAGDVDRDGDRDLVYRRGGELGVLLGNGNGTFAAGPAAPVTEVGPMALGDVNGDSKLDVVSAASLPPHRFSVHLGNGSGGFAAAVTVPSEYGFPSAIALADLNGDGRADVVVSGTQTSVFLSGLNGVPQVAWTTGIGGSVAVARLNADAVLDLAVRSTSFDAPPKMNIFLGAGNGTFTLNGSQSTLHGPTIASHDFDGDSVNDLVSVGVTYAGGLAVSHGLGDGMFAQPRITAAAGQGQFVTGDFDRDGKRDVVHVSANIASLAFVRGNGDGTFRDDRGYLPGLANVSTTGLSAADMNGDGKPDATTILANEDGTTTIAVMRNDGSGGLLASMTTPTGLNAMVGAFLVASLDGNTYADAVVITIAEDQLAARSFLGNGDGTFTAASPMALTTALEAQLRAKLADVTGDGALDLLVNGDLYEGNGNGSFDAAVSTGVRFDVAGDVDGNGTIDAIWREQNQQMRVALNTGGGGGVTFSAAVPFGSSTESPGVLADFNGDEIVDLYCSTTTGTRVFPGIGGGAFGSAIDVAVSEGPRWSDTAVDFDGDGELDVLSGLGVLSGNGDGRFRALELAGYTSSTLSESADFDGNGHPDILSLIAGMMTVHLSGFAATPVRSTTTAVTVPVPPQHATSSAYGATTSGNTVPVTGAVLFTIGGVPVGLAPQRLTVPVSTETAAYGFTMLTLPTGTHEITAHYLGSETFLPSSGATNATVDRAATTLSQDGFSGESYGTTVELKWTLTAPRAEGLAGPSTTAFALEKDGVPLAGLEWEDDSVLIEGLEASTHQLTLRFTGDENYKPSSTTATVYVNKRSPSIAFEYVPAGTARMAGPVTIKATLTAPVDYGTTTGTMEFLVDQQPAGTFPLVSHKAEVTVELPAGGHSAEMRYSGDANTWNVSQIAQLPVYLPAGTPIPLTATSRSGTSYAELVWTPVADAYSYKVYQRLTHAGSWQFVTTIFNLYRYNAGMTNGATRMYAIAPGYENGTIGPMGTPDLATRVAFTDDPVIPGTPIRAAQVTQLRTAVNAVRTYAGLSAFPFTDAALAGLAPRAVHLTELRDALTAARNAIGMPMSFSPQAPVAGGAILSTHVEEVRAGVR